MKAKPLMTTSWLASAEVDQEIGVCKIFTGVVAACFVVKKLMGQINKYIIYVVKIV